MQQTEMQTREEKIADLKAFGRKLEIEFFNGDVDNWLSQNFPDEFPAQINLSEAQNVIY